MITEGSRGARDSVLACMMLGLGAAVALYLGGHWVPALPAYSTGPGVVAFVALVYLSLLLGTGRAGTVERGMSRGLVEVGVLTVLASFVYPIFCQIAPIRFDGDVMLAIVASGGAAALAGVVLYLLSPDDVT